MKIRILVLLTTTSLVHAMETSDLQDQYEKLKKEVLSAYSSLKDEARQAGEKLKSLAIAEKFPSKEQAQQQIEKIKDELAELKEKIIAKKESAGRFYRESKQKAADSLNSFIEQMEAKAEDVLHAFKQPKDASYYNIQNDPAAYRYFARYSLGNVLYRSDNPTAYEILGIEEGANPHDIHVAYIAKLNDKNAKARITRSLSKDRAEEAYEDYKKVLDWAKAKLIKD